MSKRMSMAGFDPNQQKTLETELTAERGAQVDSVLRIIQESIEKLKISLLLPRIFENPLTLGEILSKTEYQDCVKLVQEYLKDRKKETEKLPHLNYKIVKLIDMFQEKHKMLDYLGDWLDDLSADDKALLEAFDLLYSITEQRLRKSALSELSKEKTIHQIYHENESMKKNIAEFQSKIRNQKINLRWKLAAKDGVIQKYEEDLAFKKWDNNVRIKQEIVQSSRRIRNIHTVSVLKQKELEEELEKTKAAYEKVLKENLRQEKEARDEKNKLLLQLQALIKKYDTNIGEKIKENLYLQEKYEEKKKEFDEFFAVYTKEEQEYEIIIRKREEEEKGRFEEKLMHFIMNRAARVIQRYFRRWRRDKKKKGKKGKGKKK